MQIAKLMTRDIHTCRQTDTLERAAQLMWDHDIGALAVLDDDGMLIGIVTDRDACMAAFMAHQPLHALQVSTAMNTHVVTCRPEDTSEVVASLMARHKIRRIPVVNDDQHPIGMVSLNDLALASARGNGIPGREIAATLASICEHREPVHATA
jgi:CBS domain-containing protein